MEVRNLNEWDAILRAEEEKEVQITQSNGQAAMFAALDQSDESHRLEDAMEELKKKPVKNVKEEEKSGQQRGESLSSNNTPR